MKKMIESLCALLVLVGAFAGCTSFGGRMVNVNISSDPPGSEVFVVSQIHWDANRLEELVGDWNALRTALRGCRVGGTQVTPLDARVGCNEQMLIMNLDGRIAYMPISPSEGTKLFLRIPPKAP